MQIVREIPELQALADAERAAGRRIGLVPTMGALHAGHLALVVEARRRADFVCVSIFVNPSQFGPSEDLGAYPRSFERDTERANAAPTSPSARFSATTTTSSSWPSPANAPTG